MEFVKANIHPETSSSTFATPQKHLLFNGSIMYVFYKVKRNDVEDNLYAITCNLMSMTYRKSLCCFSDVITWDCSSVTRIKPLLSMR